MVWTLSASEAHAFPVHHICTATELHGNRAALVRRRPWWQLQELHDRLPSFPWGAMQGVEVPTIPFPLLS